MPSSVPSRPLVRIEQARPRRPTTVVVRRPTWPRPSTPPAATVGDVLIVVLVLTLVILLVMAR